MRKLVINPVTRIEGHAKIDIYLDDAGHVTDTHFHVTQVRGFEKFTAYRSSAQPEEIAWQAYIEGRKATFTQKAGPGYADPDYDLSVEWIATKQRIDEAQLRWRS